MNDLEDLNRLIQKLDRIVKQHEWQYMSFSDIQQLRVFLYDLKLRIIKDKPNAH